MKVRDAALTLLLAVYILFCGWLGIHCFEHLAKYGADKVK